MRGAASAEDLQGLRKACRSDLERCFEIRESAHENRLPESYQRFLEISGASVDAESCWVWEEAGRVEGFAAYDPQSATIDVLYVHNDAQGRGIGEALLQQCCADLKALGFGRAFLSTTPGTRAQDFYRRRGWEAFAIDRAGDLRFRRRLSDL